MSEQTNVEKCLDAVSKHIRKFLLDQGAYDNGYYSSVSGVVNVKENSFIHWETPKAKEELTDKGKEVRGKQLYKELQEILKDYGLNEIVIRSSDIGYGSMETNVVYIEETVKRVRLM